MNCIYCRGEVSVIDAGDPKYTYGVCKNHGDVDVGLLLNIETQEVDFKYYQLDTPLKEYTLFIRDKLGTTTLEARGKKMTLASQTETLIEIDRIIDFTPEEFPDKLKGWLTFL